MKLNPEILYHHPEDWFEERLEFMIIDEKAKEGMYPKFLAHSAFFSRNAIHYGMEANDGGVSYLFAGRGKRVLTIQGEK